MNRIPFFDYVKHYSNWIVFILIFSIIPIIGNIIMDHVFNSKGAEIYTGAKLMDFLIVGFCLVGGAFCDRFNSKQPPSGLATGIGVLLSVIPLFIYSLIRISTFSVTTGEERYPNDELVVIVIISLYVASIFFSAFLIRKTITVD